MERMKPNAAMIATVDPVGNTSTTGATGDADDPGEADIENDDEETQEGQDPASVRQLSYQTLEGIEITVRGFTAAVKISLKGRSEVYKCQSILSGSFGAVLQQTASQGEAEVTISTSARTLHNQRSIHTQGQLKTKRNFSGNTEEAATEMESTSQPLKKRKRWQAKSKQ